MWKRDEAEQLLVAGRVQVVRRVALHRDQAAGAAADHQRHAEPAHRLGAERDAPRPAPPAPRCRLRSTSSGCAGAQHVLGQAAAERAARLAPVALVDRVGEFQLAVVARSAARCRNCARPAARRRSRAPRRRRPPCCRWPPTARRSGTARAAAARCARARGSRLRSSSGARLDAALEFLLRLAPRQRAEDVLGDVAEQRLVGLAVAHGRVVALHHHRAAAPAVLDDRHAHPVLANPGPGCRRAARRASRAGCSRGPAHRLAVAQQGQGQRCCPSPAATARRRHRGRPGRGCRRSTGSGWSGAPGRSARCRSSRRTSGCRRSRAGRAAPRRCCGRSWRCRRSRTARAAGARRWPGARRRPAGAGCRAATGSAPTAARPWPASPASARAGSRRADSATHRPVFCASTCTTCTPPLSVVALRRGRPGGAPASSSARLAASGGASVGAVQRRRDARLVVPEQLHLAQAQRAAAGATAMKASVEMSCAPSKACTNDSGVRAGGSAAGMALFNDPLFRMKPLAGYAFGQPVACAGRRPMPTGATPALTSPSEPACNLRPAAAMATRRRYMA